MKARPGSQSVVDRIQATVVSGGWCRPPLRVLMYNNFDWTISSILLMLFSAGDRYPSVVAKLCRDAGIAKQEFENLCVVRDLNANLAPAPLFLETVDGFGVLGMTAVPGKLLAQWEARVAGLPSIVTRLIAFHTNVRRGPMGRGRSVRTFSEPFEAIGRLGHDTRVERAVAAIGESLAPSFQESTLSEIPQHGDLGFSNILVARDRITVVDWEDFGRVVVPGYDLFCLLLSFYAPGDPVLLQRFWGAPDLRQSLRGAVDAYFAAFGIPRKLTGAILGFSVMRQFLCAHQLGRSSAQMLWQRVVAYVQDRDRFRHLLEE
jgi:hypothetical protein